MFNNESSCLPSCHNAFGCTKFNDNFICLCYDNLAWETLCTTNVWSEHLVEGIVYLVVGMLVLIPGLLLFLLELILHLMYHQEVNNMVFIDKMLVFGYGIIRLAYYCNLFKYYNPNQLATVLDGYIFVALLWFPVWLGILSYFMATVSWLNIVLSTTKFSKSKTRQYKITRKIYVATTIIYAPIGFILTLLRTLHSPVITIISMIWVIIPLAVTILFCLSQTYKLSQSLKSTNSDKENLLKKKNFYLSLLSLAYLAILISFGLFNINSSKLLEFRFQMVYQGTQRVLEGVLLYLSFLFFEKYVGEGWEEWYGTKPPPLTERRQGAE